MRGGRASSSASEQSTERLQGIVNRRHNLAAVALVQRDVGRGNHRFERTLGEEHVTVAERSLRMMEVVKIVAFELLSLVPAWAGVEAGVDVRAAQDVLAFVALHRLR